MPPAELDAAPNWTRLLAATAARTVLATLAGLLVWGGLPLILGWHPTTVLTGSMQPRLSIGDLAVSRPVEANALRVGQVILFDDPDHPGRLRLHRFVAVDPSGELITRGDANTANDSTPIAVSSVRGVATLLVPFVGLPRVWIQERQWGRLAALTVALVLLALGTRLDRRLPVVDETQADETQADDDQPPDGAELPPNDEPVPRRPRRLVWLVGVPILVALLAATLITRLASYAAFSDTTENPGNKLSAAAYYRCSSAITDDGPRIWYRLDETSGTTAADSSGNNRPATYRGGFTLGATRACGGDTGSAVTLNGTSGYLSSNQGFTAPNVLTEEVWFKTSSSRGGLLVGFGNAATGASGTADRQLYLTNAGKVSFSVTTGGAAKTTTSPASYNDNAWHHAAATVSTAGVILYLDGVQVAASSSATSGASYTGYVRVGYDSLKSWSDAPTSAFLAGTLDDVAVYNVALSATDIAAHYNAAG